MLGAQRRQLTNMYKKNSNYCLLSVVEKIEFFVHFCDVNYVKENNGT